MEENKDGFEFVELFLHTFLNGFETLFKNNLFIYLFYFICFFAFSFNIFRTKRSLISK